MHLKKLLPSALAVASLFVSSLCEVDHEFHLARRWVDNQRRDIEAEIRSLDEDWVIERRDLELEFRSLDPIEGAIYDEALYIRGLPAKAPAKAPAKGSSSSGGSTKSGGHKSHLIKPKACRAKAGSKSKVRRAPDGPNRKQAHEGTTVTGGGFDELETWGLKTCIGMAAANAQGTKKVLAHVNAIQGSVTWQTQLSTFKSTVQSHAPGAKITVSFPATDEGPASLHSALGQMIVGAEQVATALDGSYKAVDRAKGTSGEMIIRQNGEVECC